MNGARTAGPRAASLHGELALAILAAVVLVVAGGMWVPVALTHPPGYAGQGLLAVPVGVAVGRISWTWGCTLIAASESMLLAGAATAGVFGYRHWRPRGTRIDHVARHLGHGRDIASLGPVEVTAAARRLRPSLHTATGPLPGAAIGVVIGHTLRGDTPLLQSWEDMALDIWGPRTGKTTARAIPAIVDAPGPVVVTSVKGDVVDATRQVRAAHGGIWVFDPQHIIDTAAPAWWWNPLAGITTITDARRLASHFATAERGEDTRRDEFFDTVAENLLACFFLAAAVSGHSVLSAYRWAVRDTDDTPARILHQHGYDEPAAAVMGVLHAPDKTRGSFYAVTQKMLLSLTEPAVTRWVTPAAGQTPFDTAAFVTGRDTLYLLSHGGSGSPAPLVAAFTDAVLRAGEQASNAMPGRRLDPPLLSVLDECANIVKIRQLPDLYSHYGSRGLPIIAILQSYAQGQAVWGEAGMRKLWSAANIITYGGGVKDDAWLETVSRLVGEHDIMVRATTSTPGAVWDQSVNIQPRRQRILDVADLAALPRGRMLVLASGTLPVLARTCPWQQGPHAAAIHASLQRWDPGRRLVGGTLPALRHASDDTGGNSGAEHTP